MSEIVKRIGKYFCHQSFYFLEMFLVYRWANEASRNSLANCVEHHLKDEKDYSNAIRDFVEGKEERDIFVKSTHENVLGEFQKLMRYCCTDVLLTYHLYRNLFPLFQGKNPSWSSFYGMLKMSSAVPKYQSINQSTIKCPTFVSSICQRATNGWNISRSVMVVLMKSHRR